MFHVITCPQTVIPTQSKRSAFAARWRAELARMLAQMHHRR